MERQATSTSPRKTGAFDSQCQDDTKLVPDYLTEDELHSLDGEVICAPIAEEDLGLPQQEIRFDDLFPSPVVPLSTVDKLTPSKAFPSCPSPMSPLTVRQPGSRRTSNHPSTQASLLSASRTPGGRQRSKRARRVRPASLAWDALPLPLDDLGGLGATPSLEDALLGVAEGLEGRLAEESDIDREVCAAEPRMRSEGDAGNGLLGLEALLEGDETAHEVACSELPQLLGSLASGSSSPSVSESPGVTRSRSSDTWHTQSTGTSTHQTADGTASVAGRKAGQSKGQKQGGKEKSKKGSQGKPGEVKKGRPQLSPNPGTPLRRCSHCSSTETPQWRAGPLGPKTLCNACGVRFKSGRLCAEYRPASSPEFQPDLHSNSHRKIVEMRRIRETIGEDANDEEAAVKGLSFRTIKVKLPRPGNKGPGRVNSSSGDLKETGGGVSAEGVEQRSAGELKVRVKRERTEEERQREREARRERKRQKLLAPQQQQQEPGDGVKQLPKKEPENGNDSAEEAPGEETPSPSSCGLLSPSTPTLASLPSSPHSLSAALPPPLLLPQKQPPLSAPPLLCSLPALPGMLASPLLQPMPSTPTALPPPAVSSDMVPLAMPPPAFEDTEVGLLTCLGGALPWDQVQGGLAEGSGDEAADSVLLRLSQRPAAGRAAGGPASVLGAQEACDSPGTPSMGPSSGEGRTCNGAEPGAGGFGVQGWLGEPNSAEVTTRRAVSTFGLVSAACGRGMEKGQAASVLAASA